MRATVARREACDSSISFELFQDELIGGLATLLPEVRVAPRAGGVRFGRGSATVDVTSARDESVKIVFRHAFDRVLGGMVPLTAEGLNDLAADLVGFFCGASLSTLALFPKTEPVNKPRLRKRRGPYDAPLIPLPFEPALKVPV
jgi:hypothetical protein